MTVLLDTQILIQAYLGDALPKRVQTFLKKPETVRLVSVVSLVEIAIKSSAGKLAISVPDLNKATRDLALAIIPFKPEHAFRLFALPDHHRDPFDRMLIATALVEGLPLVGGDRQFKQYTGLKLIW